MDDGASKKKFRPFGGGPKPHAGEFRDELFQWFVDVHATCFFFMKNTFISNARLKWTKNQVNATQHHEVECLLFENYWLSSSTSSSKSSWRNFKECAKRNCLFYDENEVGSEK